jgi:hypothetical protein
MTTLAGRVAQSREAKELAQVEGYVLLATGTGFK